MGNIIVTDFLSLDGVMEAPERWSLEYWNDAIAAFKDQELRSSDAHLLGRATYEIFADAWPSRTAGRTEKALETHRDSEIRRGRCLAALPQGSLILRALSS